MANKSLGYIELNWTCPNCNTVNLGSNKTCSACGSPQPENIHFTQQTTQTLLKDEEKIAQARKGADVHCPYCGTRNSAEKEACRQCGGDLADGARRVAGRIIGAYGSTSTTTDKDLACPACQQPNQPNAQFCVYCGTPLQTTAPQTNDGFIAPSSAPLKNKTTPSQTSTAQRKKLPVWFILILLLIIGACAIGLLALIFGNRNVEPVQAIVTETYWKYSVEIEEQQYVTREGWEDAIPSQANLLSCNEELHNVQSEPAQGAVEVCGTPYSVDQGNGYAEIVQDCEYKIYKLYCSYEILDWVLTDTVITEGYDLYPYWDETPLNNNQRLGEQEESYRITFADADQDYDYTPSDLYTFEQCEVGSTWELDLSLFGGIKSIKRVE